MFGWEVYCDNVDIFLVDECGTFDFYCEAAGIGPVTHGSVGG